MHASFKHGFNHFSLGLEQQTCLHFYYFRDKGGSDNGGGCGNDGLLFRSVCMVLFCFKEPHMNPFVLRLQNKETTNTAGEQRRS